MYSHGSIMCRKGYTLKFFFPPLPSSHHFPHSKVITVTQLQNMYAYTDKYNIYSFLYPFTCKTKQRAKQPVFVLQYTKLLLYLCKKQCIYLSAPCFFHSIAWIQLFIIRAIHKGLWDLRYLYFVLMVKYLVKLEIK